MPSKSHTVKRQTIPEAFINPKILSRFIMEVLTFRT